jgi:hypothetical protein
MVSSKPSSLTFTEAASVPVIAETAWQALFDRAQLKAGQTVLIQGQQETLALMRLSGQLAWECDPSRTQALRKFSMCATLAQT